MNTTCSLNRFKKMLALDVKRSFRQFGLVLLIMALFDLVAWGLAMTFHPFQIKDWETDPRVRQTLFSFILTLVVALAPSVIYGNCNKRSKGIYFAMLPASHGEKFWSMVLICYVAVPVAITAGFVLVDSLLTLLPFGPYREWIWKGMMDMGVNNNMTFDANGGVIEMPSIGVFGNIVMWVVSVWLIASIFMFGNVLFRKVKFIFSLLWLQVIDWVLSILIIVVAVLCRDSLMERVSTWIDPAMFEHDMKAIMWGTTAAIMVVTVLCTWLTWHRLKRVQY